MSIRCVYADFFFCYSSYSWKIFCPESESSIYVTAIKITNGDIDNDISNIHTRVYIWNFTLESYAQSANANAIVIIIKITALLIRHCVCEHANYRLHLLFTIILAILFIQYSMHFVESKILKRLENKQLVNAHHKLILLSVYREWMNLIIEFSFNVCIWVVCKMEFCYCYHFKARNFIICSKF